jgi:hypothetical protein
MRNRAANGTDKVADAGRDRAAKTAISRCSSAEPPHCGEQWTGSVAGRIYSCSPIMTGSSSEMRSRVVMAALRETGGHVMEIDGGRGAGPRTGEPFAAERVAVFHEGRDAAEGE